MKDFTFPENEPDEIILSFIAPLICSLHIIYAVDVILGDAGFLGADRKSRVNDPFKRGQTWILFLLSSQKFRLIDVRIRV